MTNSKHEQLKNRVNDLECAKRNQEVAAEKLETVRKEKLEKDKDVVRAKDALARTIYNKCTGKTLIYGGILFKVEKREEGTLVLEATEFVGEII